MFYQRPTTQVAMDLLGKRLVRVLPDGSLLSGLIVETEAYLGIRDRACHTFDNKRTPRTEPMYLEGAHAYIYLIYGMYHCFNVVTEKKDVPEAVLIRALEPDQGIEKMKKIRKTELIKNLCSGPGKLCRALKIDRTLNAHLLLKAPLFIEDVWESVKPSQIVKCPRVWVDYAGAHARWKLRFYIRGNEFVSK